MLQRIVVLVTGVALTACASPAAPVASTPTSLVAPTSTPDSEATPVAIEPSLQSHLDGPEAEKTLVPAQLPVTLPTPVPPPVETIIPADQCDDARVPPALGPANPGGFTAFRVPLPSTPLYNPPGQKRIGLQAGHWQNSQVPPELGRLQAGAVGGGKQEWEVNLDIAGRAKRLLEAEGLQVDLLPATVPARYQAHVFLAIHADGDTNGAISGYKIARPGFSSIPSVDDRLVQALYSTYGERTRLARDDEHISLRMRYYYAFNSRRYCHAVAPGVPQAIIETGFLTSASDRQTLLGNPDAPARGIADGIKAFLDALP